MYSLYRGLNWGPSDPEADDKPMCHHALIIMTMYVVPYYVLTIWGKQ